MKLLVETNGNYGLYDLMNRQVIQANRPTVVENTSFIQVQRGNKLTVLEVLADEASDMPLQVAKNSTELAEAIAALPRPQKPAPKTVEPKSEETETEEPKRAGKRGK